MKKALFLLSFFISVAGSYAETWTPVGKITWNEGILTSYRPGSGSSWQATVERSDDRPYMFRSQVYATTGAIGSVSYGRQNYVYFNMENPKRVYIQPYEIATYDKSGNHEYIVKVTQRCPENGFDTNYYGSISDDGCAVSFPPEAFFMEYRRYRESPSYPGSGNNSQPHSIVFPEGVLGYTPEPESWINIGQGKWEDPVFTNQDFNPATGEISIEKSVQNPGKYRTKIYEDKYVFIHTENPSKVYISPYSTVNSQGTVVTVSQNCAENGMSGAMYGTLSDGKITIPGDYFVITFEGLTGSDIGNSSRKCEIVFPEGFDNPLPENNGIFMGVIAFNDEIYRKQLSVLDETTKEDFTSFINDLQMGNATLLYYAVDQAISSLKSQTFPENLSNAVIVTFTDGLDQGSLAMKPEHRTSRGYASYLYDLIGGTSIQGHKLEAFAIGLKSEDVYDDELFMYNLQSLASADENVMPVNNISEMQQKLTNLFENLNRQTTQRIVTIKVPMMSHGDKYRFTLDNCRNSANTSDIWFEGTFNIDNMSLDDVAYSGFTSTSGATLTAKQEGIKLVFTLDDCRNLVGGILDVDQNSIDQWQYIPSRDIWNHNVENAKAEDIDIQNIKSSVAVMFALDCSTSLGELFPLVKTTANSFIDRLAGGNGGAGIEDILVDTVETIDINDPDVEIYNLQGMRVYNPSSGIYICRKGSIAKKIIIR